MIRASSPAVSRSTAALLILLACLLGLCRAHGGKFSQHPEARIPGTHFYPSSDGPGGAEHIDSHLKEDLGLKIDTTNMTAEEMDWYFFMLHDTDKNFMLDGIEMLQGWLHTFTEAVLTAKQGSSADDMATATKLFIDMIDDTLAKEDLDKDGYISYTEYVRGKSQKHV